MEFELRDIIDNYCDEYGAIADLDEMQDEVEQFFNKRNALFVMSRDCMFENPGIDISSVSIAWIENEEPQLLVYRYVIR